MPVFHAHIPKGHYSSDQKTAIARSLNLSLVQGLGIPKEDCFICLSEHAKDELFIHPTFMGMQRSTSALIITVLIGDHRPSVEKQQLMATITELLKQHVGISPDDVFIALIPVPNENFSFGQGMAQLAGCSPQW